MTKPFISIWNDWCHGTRAMIFLLMRSCGLHHLKVLLKSFLHCKQSWTNSFQKCRLYCSFIDFKRALDTVDKSKLWNWIQIYGIRGKHLWIVRSSVCPTLIFHTVFFIRSRNNKKLAEQFENVKHKSSVQLWSDWHIELFFYIPFFFNVWLCYRVRYESTRPVCSY